MHQLPPSSDFRLRNASPRQVGATRRVLVSTQTGERDRPGRGSERPVTNILRSVRRDADRCARDARAPPSAIIKRKPLSSTARRAGWVGCNFALNRIPVEARIAMVITRSSGRESAPTSLGEDGKSQSRLTSAATIIVPPEEVRERFRRIKPLKGISITQRGWTLDVLNIVLGSATVPVAVGNVSLRTASASSVRRDADRRARDARAPHFTRELEKLHPDNPVNNRVTQGKPPRPGHLSHLGNGERNLAESKGPRGPSERARASPNPPATPNPPRCRIIDSSRS